MVVDRKENERGNNNGIPRRLDYQADQPEVLSPSAVEVAVMNKPKLRRWKCPRCGAGKLAPSRARKDDVRGYCLPCSEATGRLVRRGCPSLDAERARKAERQEVRKRRLAQKQRARSRQASRKRSQERLAALEPWLELARSWLSLDAWEGAFRRGRPKLRIRGQFTTKHWTTGHAKGSGKEIFLTLLPAGDEHAESENRTLILHEIAHAAAMRLIGRRVVHGQGYKMLYLAAVREVVENPDWRPQYMRPMWKMDSCVTQQLADHLGVKRPYKTDSLDQVEQERNGSMAQSC